jgi:L-amino acid N-acyltransferase YncA
VLRHADPSSDAAACAAIYELFVRDSGVSFEDEPPDEQEMAERIARIGLTHPWLVVELEGGVAGFAYGSPHRARRAYRWAADVAVYVDPAHQRRGLGLMLYGPLLALLRRQRLRVACAGITLPNEASVGLHESLGFVPVGVYERIGWKAGAWRDVGWWQLQLGAASGEEAGAARAPTEPLGPQTLDSL